METRVLNIVSPDGEWLESIRLLRLDPDQFRFDVAYQPGEPKGLLAWQMETGAVLIVNGGFFTEANDATGLVISGGQTYGRSYEQFGGMFAVSATGPDLRWLPQQPYDPGEPLQAALQSFPMLLAPGGVAVPGEDDGNRERRTVVARDQQGRILFLIAGYGHFTLYGLGQYLTATDLALDVALNLDGGASSGLLLAEPLVHIPAFVLLPTVIVVHDR
jgi:uncharacterized protein YigE (DUF2233 family)